MMARGALRAGVFVFFAISVPWVGHAAFLSLEPPSGAFVVGSTFDVPIFLNTEGKSINALDVLLEFPPALLQLVSPSTGNSVVGIWTSQPRFNNQAGTVHLQGGIPGGITVSRGLLANLTFRVKAVGSAIVKFSPSSKVLLNDGKGTDDLRQVSNGVYRLVLPPPLGPTVVSETHPDQSRWYPNATVLLNWASEEGADNYSFILSGEPFDVPDDTPEGKRNSVVYKNLSDGKHYFHIKSFKSGAWGGVTHFSIKVDTSPPAQFPIEIVPGARTTRRQPVVQFSTTDLLSGVDHYELKIIPLQPVAHGSEEDQLLFFEAQSPFVLQPLQDGSYDVIVRAYDVSGNFYEATQRLKVVPAIFQFIKDEGIQFRSALLIPWRIVWIAFAALILLLGTIAWGVKRWHDRIAQTSAGKKLPDSVQKQLEELKRYKERYKMFIALLCVGALALSANVAAAQGVTSVSSPPLVTSVSRSISNQEIFYMGGESDLSDASVIIYIQNVVTGETSSVTTPTGRRGEWFYRHSAFLPAGEYILWAQSRVGDFISPPSPQFRITVQKTAFQVGTSRISYEALYLGIIVLLAGIVVVLIVAIVRHLSRARRVHRILRKEIQEAEASVRSGFAILRRDIAAELATIQKAKLSQMLSAEEKMREEQLMKDLEWVENNIGKEVLDIGQVDVGL
jgi:uncharacterized membrane protein YhaH (DUF805 family)